jgi:hypothetical protein
VFTRPPPSHLYVRRLQSLNAEFSHGRSEALTLWFFVLVSICGGAFAVGTAVYLRRTMDFYRPLWPITVVGVAFVVLGLFVFVRRVGVIYRFQSGTLTEISGSGKVRWQESLEDLETYLESSSSRGMSTLKLKWRTHSRTIELMDSLSQALYR